VDSSAEPEVADDEAASEVSLVDTSLSLERDMERTLLRNLAQLEAGLQLYERDGVSGNQFDTGAVGRLDILAVDDRDNLVVVELKAGRAHDRVCGQILRYIGWVKENLAGHKSGHNRLGFRIPG
jgi:RecB family endonuclease NucS